MAQKTTGVAATRPGTPKMAFHNSERFGDILKTKDICIRYVYLEFSKGSQVPKMAETLVKDFFFELPEEYGSRMPCFL